MFSHLSAANELFVDYPIFDNHLPFSDYITRCRTLVIERRTDLQHASMAEQIINANSPFEYYPAHPLRTNQKLKYGVLLVHGLLDCPFSLKEIAAYLQTQGILSRAILLPGHGTTPSDLCHVSYHDWIQAVRYGVETLRHEVEHIFLMGYSTGAALSIYHTLQDNQIAGLVLLSPAIRIKAPVSIVVNWHYARKWLSFSNQKEWLCIEEEIDYAKYRSIAFNPVIQVAKLTAVIHELRQHHALTKPVLMIMSREDETVSSHKALNFFSRLPNPENKLLLYTSIDHRYPDSRIITRQTHYPFLHINHFSHVSIPFSPQNIHYGENGEYCYASRKNIPNTLYGAYNNIEEKLYDSLYQCGLIRYQRRELTYNPDFDHMTKQIAQFILQSPQSISAA